MWNNYCAKVPHFEKLPFRNGENLTVELKVNKYLFYITPLVLKSYTFGYDVQFRNIPSKQIYVASGSKGSIILLNT